MVYFPTFKLFVLLTFPAVVLLQKTGKKVYNFDEAYRKAIEKYRNAPKPYCPEEDMAHFKDCRGELKGCSNCLGYADRMCQVSGSRHCKDCLLLAGRACDNPKKMCFGNQECGGLASDYRCINFSCKFARS